MSVARTHAVSHQELAKWRELVQRSLPHSESIDTAPLAWSVEELSRHLDQLRKQLAEMTLENALLRLQLEVIRAGSSPADDKLLRIISQLSSD